MTAQLANGGFKIQPRIIDDKQVIYEDVKSNIDDQLKKYGSKPKEEILTADVNLDLMKTESLFLKPLFKIPRMLNL